MNGKVCLVAACLVGLAACKGPSAQPPILDVEGGKIQGVEENGVLVFKGVPFAAPPVGENKGKSPQPVVAWEGVRIADTFAPAAMQSPFSPEDPLYYKEFYAEGDPEFSEDCLYLNLWVPASSVGKPEAKTPVAVWIHGGAFNHGYSYEKEMDGTEWARRGVILVTIPYRLGELGFGADGPLGFEDQTAALRWVHENITAFGGDPDNVTLLGQSAGAMSVKQQFTIPEARPLFAKAIIQSGGGVNDMSQPPILPVGTRGETLPGALKSGCFDGKPILIGWTAQDLFLVGKEPSLDFCEKLYARGNHQIYVYDFERNLPGEAEGEMDFGAFHSAELWYMFGTLDRAWRPFTEGDRDLSRRMLDAWTGFAKHSNPGWEAYTSENPHIHVFDVKE